MASSAPLLVGALQQTPLWLRFQQSLSLRQLSLWSLLSWLIVASLATYVLVSSVLWFRTVRVLRKFPGPGNPLLFVLTLYRYCTSHPELDFNVGIMNLFYGLSRAYQREKAFKVYLGPKPHIYVYSPEAMQIVLSQPSNLDKTYVYSLLDRWLGQGLLTRRGSTWKSRRHLLTPGFHMRVLEDSLGTMNAAASDLTSALLQLSTEEGLVGDLVPHVQRCSLRVICEAAMGLDIETLQGSRCYIKALMSVGESFTHRFVRPWLWNRWIYYWCTSAGRRESRNMHNMRMFTLQVIEVRKNSLLESGTIGAEGQNGAQAGKRRQCFLDVLLDLHLRSAGQLEQQGLSLEDVQDEVETFLFAGHDTTTANIAFTLFLLGHAPEVQQRLYEELESHFQDVDRPVTKEDLQHLRYLDCVIKESLRLYPSAPIVGRSVTEEITLGGHVVPPGSELLLFLYALHRDADMFPDPEKFDPDRFLRENAKCLHPYAFLPFSGGQRNCIGQKFAKLEDKVVLATVIRRCHVTSLDPRDRLQIACEIVLRSKTPLRLRFQPRLRPSGGRSA